MTTSTTESFVPTPGQAAVLRSFRDFMRASVADWPVFSLCGFAGTGKTTLVRHLVDAMRADADGDDVPVVRVVAPTGKAASVLCAKGFAGATTVHALLYTPNVVNRLGTDGEVTGQELVFSLKVPDMDPRTRLIVVDEASMVDQDMARDLLSLRVKVLAIGDPFQLPPVKTATSDLLSAGSPDAMLTEVTRQAYDSPVLHLATVIRERQELLRGTLGESVVCTREQAAGLSFTGQAPFIVGLNRTRHAQNFSVRRLLGRADWWPEVGDRLLCRRNDRRTGLINGEVHVVDQTFARSDLTSRLTLSIRAENDDPDMFFERVATSREVVAWTHLFKGEDGEAEPAWMRMSSRRQCQELTYGYAITCHASQGSEWPTVVVIDEGEAFGEHRWRWLYTAITRASERVAVIS